MSYASKLVMHADLQGGGVMNVYELPEYPGITIVDTWEKRNSKGVRKIVFDEQEFETIAAAVEAWKWKPSSD